VNSQPKPPPIPFPIRSGIPVPRPRSTGLTATIEALEIGQSFDMAKILAPASYSIAKSKGRKVRTQQLPNDMVRVWRVA
jgi:hypothetical protein